jgi:hypothetical protein
MRNPLKTLPGPVRVALAGLLAVAVGCGSKAATGGAGGGGRGGGGGAGTPGTVGAAGAQAGVGAGATGGVGTTGDAGPIGGAGTTGRAGITGGAGTAGVAGAGVAGAGTAGSTGGRGGSGGNGGAIPFYPLDMNDVTILTPPPQSIATPVLLRGTDLADDGTVFVPRALYDRLVTDPLTGGLVATGVEPHNLIDKYDRLHLIAVRFDLCDRHLPGACPQAEDGRMRLVFQLATNGSGAEDVGFHAFYAIRNDEIAGAVAALRDLARAAPPQSGALRVSPALSAADAAAYAATLRAFVKRYGGETRLVRLTMNALNSNFGQITWEFRGVEKNGDAFVAIPIVGSTTITEQVSLTGTPGYDVRPLADTPSGLQGASQQHMFDTADAAAKRGYLAALAAADNPLRHTAETVACAACHVSTVLLGARATAAAIDPLTLTDRYTSTRDLSIAGGKSAQTQNTLRALGYLGTQPMISQRVVNDTAQTLAEIDQRFPAP